MSQSAPSGNTSVMSEPEPVSETWSLDKLEALSAKATLAYVSDRLREAKPHFSRGEAIMAPARQATDELVEALCSARSVDKSRVLSIGDAVSPEGKLKVTLAPVAEPETPKEAAP